MSDYTWTGGAGAFDDPSMWTVGGSAASTPPGASDDADFASGGMVTGSGSVADISIEGATTFSSGTVATSGGVDASAAVTINSGGNLDSSGSCSFDDDVTISDGGQFESDFTNFNGGSVTVTGDGSSYTDQGWFAANGTDGVTIADDASVTTGTDPGDLDTIQTGSLSLTGDATLTVADLTTFNGTTWSIDDGATLNALGGGNLSGAGLVGVLFNGSGSIDGATLSTQAGLTFGGQGFEGVNSTGDATIENDADASAGVLILGDYQGDSGFLTLDGSGTTLTLASSADYTGVPGTALIGNSGTGTLVIQGGAVLDETCGDGGFASIAYDTDGSTGQATVDGEGSAWSITGTLNVGDGGTGTLSVQNMGSASATTLNVSAQSSSGTDDDPSLLTVDGDGSVMMVAQNATIDTATADATNASGEPNGMCGNWDYGDSGVGQIVVTDGGYVSIGGALTLQAPDDPDAPATVSIDATGSMEVGGRGKGAAGMLVVDAAGLVIGHGTIAVDAAGDGSPPNGTISVADGGAIEAYQGTLDLDADLTGAGTYEIDTDATMQVGGAVDADSTITFDGGYTTTLALDDPADFSGVAANFVEGDTIDLTTLTPSPPMRLSYGLDGVLTLQAIGGGSGGVSGGEYDIKIAGTDEVPVFGLTADKAGTGTDITTVSLLTLLGIAFAVYAFDPEADPSVVTPAQVNDYGPIPIGGSISAFPGAVGDAGFQAFAYQDDNDADCDQGIVIVFRGTYTHYWDAAIKNILADTTFVSSQINAMMLRYVTDAVQYVLKVHAAYPDSPITLTGHSLGGAIAQIVGFAAGLPVAAFNAPQFGQLYSQLAAALAPVEDLGLGGTNVNYRLAGDVVSLAGTPLPGTETFTVPSPYPVTTPSLILGNVLNSHGVSDPPNISFASINAGLVDNTGGQQLSWLQQAIINGGVALLGPVLAGINYLADPTSGTAFVVSVTGASPDLASIGLPELTGVASYDVSYETGDAWSGVSIVAPGSIDTLPAGVDGVQFDPLAADGSADAIPGALFTLSFASAGTLSGSVLASGGTTVGVQAASGSLEVQPGGGAVALDIAAPTDSDSTVTTADIGVEVSAVPSNGTVFLSDGTTPVTAGELLSVGQLTGLMFAPDASDRGAVSSLDYVANDPALYAASGEIALQVACFAEGTRIATLRGDVPVQELKPGDRVVLARETSATRAIVWLGHRSLDCRRHPRPGDVWPVRVRAGAFGAARPRRDLLLSPDHAVFFGGALVPIRYLVNGATIVQQPAARISYWHVELERHDALLAEGLPCESYLDTGNRAAFADGGPVVHLHPEFSRRIWRTRAFAPLVLDGPRLPRARRRLLAQAAALGHRLTGDPGLTAWQGGQRLAMQAEGGLCRLRLPDRTRDVRLVSRAWVPAWMRPDEADPRKLGIAVGRLWLDGREASLESPGLSRGWHAPEPGWRWTDGDATIAVAGARELAFAVAMTGSYWEEERCGRRRFRALRASEPT